LFDNNLGFVLCTCFLLLILLWWGWNIT
jgi:hypothetical protein